MDLDSLQIEQFTQRVIDLDKHLHVKTEALSYLQNQINTMVQTQSQYMNFYNAVYGTIVVLVVSLFAYNWWKYKDQKKEIDNAVVTLKDEFKRAIDDLRKWTDENLAETIMKAHEDRDWSKDHFSEIKERHKQTQEDILSIKTSIDGLKNSRYRIEMDKQLEEVLQLVKERHFDGAVFTLNTMFNSSLSAGWITLPDIQRIMRLYSVVMSEDIDLSKFEQMEVFLSEGARIIGHIKIAFPQTTDIADTLLLRIQSLLNGEES